MSTCCLLHTPYLRSSPETWACAPVGTEPGSSWCMDHSTTEPHGLAILLFSHSFHAMVLTSDLGPPGLLPLTRQEVGQAPGEVLPSRASCRDGGSRDTWILESVVFIRNPVCPHLFLPSGYGDGHLERRARDHEQKLGLRVSCPIRSHSGPLRRGGRRATNLGAHRQTWEEAGAS